MILFFNKKTREIVGHIEGRVHPQEAIDGVEISMTGTPKKDIEKYVVPTVRVFEEIMVKEGKKKVKRVKMELLPFVPFADKILEFEANLSKIREHKVKLNKEGKLMGFEKINKK